MINQLKQFWKYLKKDTWDSWLVSLLLILIFIKLIFFPILSIITGTPLPLVVVESCSMFHSSNFNSWIEQNSAFYESVDISQEKFASFPFKNGLNKGDIILLWRVPEPKIGDIIVFEAQAKHPLIHRLISISPLSTKGDNNLAQLSIEKNIPESSIIGKAVIKIPLIGWVKLIFFEAFKSEEQRGFCS